MDLFNSAAFAWLAGVKNGFQKSVTLKMRLAPWKADVSDAGSWRLAVIISMPFAVIAWEAGELVLRVRPRTFHWGSWRKTLATDPP